MSDNSNRDELGNQSKDYIPDYDPSIHWEARLGGGFGGGMLGALPGPNENENLDGARERHLSISRNAAFTLVCDHYQVKAPHPDDAHDLLVAQMSAIAVAFGISPAEPDYAHQVMQRVVSGNCKSCVNALTPQTAPFYFFKPEAPGVKPSQEVAARRVRNTAGVMKKLLAQALKKQTPSIVRALEDLAKEGRETYSTLQSDFYATTTEYERHLIKQPRFFVIEHFWRHSALKPLDGANAHFSTLPQFESVVTTVERPGRFLAGLLARRLNYSVCHADQVELDQIPYVQSSYLQTFGTKRVNQRSKDYFPAIGIIYRGDSMHSIASKLAEAIERCGFPTRLEAAPVQIFDNLSRIILLPWGIEWPENLKVESDPAAAPVQREHSLQASIHFRSPNGSVNELPRLPRLAPQSIPPNVRRRGVNL